MLQKLFLCLLTLLFVGFSNQAISKESKIQVALLLDTSNSMDGLINQAKAQLWNVVKFEYGKQSLAAEVGFVKRISPFTSDLDKISEELFALKTNGGDEYCGWVIDSSVNDLDWSKKNSDLKVIYIAGNEGFNQGQKPYDKACKKAISDGIIVNTIFCGDYNTGVNLKWKDGADLSDGKYINIDANQQLVHVDAPQDDEIAKLNSELNTTYISYGSEGKAKMERQAAQDVNASSLNKSVAVQRAKFKSNAAYKNAKWDLADAFVENEAIVEEIVEEELPEVMQDMDTEERKEYVQEQLDKRTEIRNQINTLVAEREDFVANARKENADENTLEKAILNSIKEQACDRNFEFE